MKHNLQESNFRARRLRSRRRGSTLFIAAGAIVSLMGCAAFAVDYGLLVADANRLQRGADAAALAGAHHLWKSGTDPVSVAFDKHQAKELAITVAARNAVKITADDVTFPSDNKIKVSPAYQRKFLFAPVLGFDFGKVHRSAIAGRIPLKVATGVVPIAMTTVDYQLYKSGISMTYSLIRNHDQDFTPGTVTALDLRNDNSGKSGSLFQDDLTAGFDGPILYNQEINSALNADIQSQGQKLERALEQRFREAAQAPYADTGENYTYPNYPPEDRRIIMLMVADPRAADNNNPMLNARFIVPVYVESVASTGGKNVSIKFRILPSHTVNSQNPDVELGDSSTPYSGVSVVTLTQ